ncbi:hypothetical protein COV93_00455 [Candidatus Woesearchaeota archaeon CG11_big_fil_rev_8_21_14_0_20_43_8]|nr:MAG: hypothetical protein COV93_00455 [Candidatus Woesearchaeota archaeon CG11_big_fil_rev_8_21_14_0_20_43_8]PIO06914.1 MAG: hypothetical protein COT47_02235 [Candidatus Woesearchaeota archaeon CG08_land_8_20_14_0_20_43_7]
MKRFTKGLVALITAATIGTCGYSTCSGPDLEMKEGYSDLDKSMKQEVSIPFVEKFDVRDNRMKPVSADELHQELSGFMSLRNNKDREKYGILLFLQAGFKESDISRQRVNSDYNNIIVEKKGKSDKTIVIGAHIDRVSQGKGIIDNASGSTLVTNLAQAIRGEDTKYTYRFVLFTLEESGLIGSRNYVKRMTKDDKDRFAYMINADCVGVEHTVIYANISNDGLESTLAKIGEQRGFVFRKENLSPWYGVDSLSFRRAGLPSGSLATTNYEDKIHKPSDTIDKIDKKELAKTYQLMLDLLFVTERSKL